MAVHENSPQYLSGHKCSGSCGSKGFCGLKGFLQHFSQPGVASGNPYPHPAERGGQSMPRKAELLEQEFRLTPSPEQQESSSPSHCQSRSPKDARPPEPQHAPGLGRVLQVASLVGSVPPLHRIPERLGLGAALKVVLFHPCHGRGVLSSATASKCSQSRTVQSNEQCHLPEFQEVSFPQKLIPRVSWSAPAPGPAQAWSYRSPGRRL